MPAGVCVPVLDPPEPPSDPRDACVGARARGSTKGAENLLPASLPLLLCVPRRLRAVSLTGSSCPGLEGNGKGSDGFRTHRGSPLDFCADESVCRLGRWEEDQEKSVLRGGCWWGCCGQQVRWGLSSGPQGSKIPPTRALPAGILIAPSSGGWRSTRGRFWGRGSSFWFSLWPPMAGRDRGEPEGDLWQPAPCCFLQGH